MSNVSPRRSLLIAVGTLLMCSTAWAEARFDLVLRKHHMGQTKQGDPVKTSFQFKNGGSSELQISSVASSCACLVADWPKSAVKPGESATISVTLDTKALRGVYEKSLTVISNADEGIVSLAVSGTVTAP